TKLIGVLPLHVPLLAVSVCPTCATPLTLGGVTLLGGAGSVTTILCSTVAVRPRASVTTKRTYFVPAPTNVNFKVCPSPRGHRGGMGRVGPPSSDHSYLHGPSGQVEPEPFSVTA